MPARITTESVSWLNDHINGNVKVDGYFHSDYIFNSAPPHYINYNNVINLQNPFLYSFHEPDQMTDADGTTYRIEYFWAAVGAGGNYNLTFANQNFSGTFGSYRETIRWYTREVLVQSTSSQECHPQPLFMFSSSLNVSLNGYALSNGAKTNLIEAAARYNYSDNQMWYQFRRLDQVEQTIRYNKSLGKAGTNYLKTSNVIGKVVGWGSISLNALEGLNYCFSGGTDWKVYTKLGLDITMSLIGMYMGPVGLVISSTYYFLDVSTGGFGGFGKY